ncbi:DUF4373 domain-containing protein [Enterococcus faecium]|nr:DUF4373 domain-containing protein [Enterococcus faecium]
MNDSYFPHDSNARNSDKLIPVRMKYGAEGYGIYFMILERLREEKNYMSIKDYNTLAFDLRVDTSKIKAIVEDFGLFAFTENGECFYSEGFNKRMEIKDAKSRKRSEAGKKGASKRWQKNSNAIAMPSDENSKTENTNAIATEKNGKESKGKETKEKESKVSSSASSVDLNSENSAVSYWLNQVNPAEAPTVLESIRFWVNDFQGQDEIVIMAIEEMLKNGARNYNYLDKVLKSWENKQLDTVDKVKKHLQGHYSKSSKNNQIRKEPIPKWLDDPEGYNKQKERGYEDVPF